MSELIEGLSNRVLSTTGCKVTEEAIALIIYEYEQQRANEQRWIKGFLNEVEDVLFSEGCLEGNKAKRALDKIEALLPKPPQEQTNDE